MLDSEDECVNEVLPAVIEAHYQGRPLIVITGDRSEKYRGSGAPQAIEQVDLFNNYVEGCDDLGGREELDLFGEWSGRRPWHLNVCLEEDEEVPAVECPEESEGDESSKDDSSECVSVEHLNETAFYDSYAQDLEWV